MESGEHFISGHLQRHTLHFRVDVDENKTYRLYGSSKFIFYYGSTSSYRSTISSIIVFCLSTYFFWRRSTICAFHPISVNLDQNGKLCISTTTTTILWLRVYFYFIGILSFVFITLNVCMGNLIVVLYWIDYVYKMQVQVSLIRLFL